MGDKYLKTMSNIKASDDFRERTLQRLEREQKKELFMSKKMIAGLAACFIVAVGAIGFNLTQTPATSTDVATVNLLDRIIVDDSGVSASVMVNIEGTIVEVGNDGLSFKLDNGKWVKVVDATVLGITGPTAAAPEDQLFEPTFRVGNSISGFAENVEEETITAYAIYSNWNWNDPIRD